VKFPLTQAIKTGSETATFYTEGLSTGQIANKLYGILGYESELVTETEPESEPETEPESEPQTVEPKEEGKKLHVAIFYQEKAKPKKEKWNYRNVVRVIGNHAKDHHEPMAVKYYGAALFLAHLMDTGRLTGTKVFFKIWKLSTREVCNLIVEIHNQMIKNSYIDEYGIIKWLSKKARKSPYDIAA
ncbi:MAG: hypothetical protein ACKPFF_32380, partial [Planktothrix sp.]